MARQFLKSLLLGQKSQEHLFLNQDRELEAFLLPCLIHVTRLKMLQTLAHSCQPAEALLLHPLQREHNLQERLSFVLFQNQSRQ